MTPAPRETKYGNFFFFCFLFFVLTLLASKRWNGKNAICQSNVWGEGGGSWGKQGYLQAQIVGKQENREVLFSLG